MTDQEINEVKQSIKTIDFNISMLQREQEKLRKMLTRLPEAPQQPAPRPKDEWKVGDKAAYQSPDKVKLSMFTVHKIEDGYLWDSDFNMFGKNRCHRVFNLQIEGDPLGPGSWVKTPEGWVGMITHQETGRGGSYCVDDGRRDDVGGVMGFFKLADLTATAKPEGI